MSAMSALLLTLAAIIILNVQAIIGVVASRPSRDREDV